MMTSPMWMVAGVAVGILAGAGAPLAAQHPVDGQEFMFSNLRPSGQPVIPIFDGWYTNPDGTMNLCFGYFNLNTEEVVEIPLGPDNRIEPARFDGMQPSHFLPLPPPPNLYRRYFCTFTVNVPAGFEERVVWTLRLDGREYSVPGHVQSPNYQLEELIQPSRGSVAPVVRFEAEGAEGRGRSGDLRVGPLEVAVGRPLTLTTRVTWPEGVPTAQVVEEGGTGGDEREGPRRMWWVKWAKHQGPGAVAFTPGEIDVLEGQETVAATATFEAPGRYLLRMQAIDSPGEGGSYQFHCCWTNAFVEVNVTP